jgi:hypothetical protein
LTLEIVSFHQGCSYYVLYFLESALLQAQTRVALVPVTIYLHADSRGMAVFENLGDPRLGTRLEFRRNRADDDPALWVTPQQMASRGIAFGYVDARSMTEQAALTSLGVQLGTDHPPYDPKNRGWLRFMDDLLGLSERTEGMAIVVDNASSLISADPAGFSWGEDLIKWWSIALDHWVKKGRPCQLCFQIDTNAAVRQVYGTATHRN